MISNVNPNDPTNIPDIISDLKLRSDLEIDFRINEALPNLSISEKTALLIDGNNIYRRAKDNGFAISYSDLSSILEKRCNLVAKYMFTALRLPDPNLEKWIYHLTKNNFEVVSKEVKTTRIGDDIVAVKGNMDVEITIGALTLDPSIEHIILMTCDDSFVALVKYLKYVQNKKVSVMGMTIAGENSVGMPSTLTSSAANFYNLMNIKDYITYKKDRL